MVYPFMPFLLGGFKLFFLKGKKKKHNIYSPVKGKVIPLEEVGDGVFSEKLIGDGIAVIPSDDQIVIPVDGTVSFIMETGHAFGIKIPNGPEVLVHIGIDTVNEKGHGFEMLISEKQKVSVGVPAVVIRRKELEKKGYNMSVMVLIPEVEKYGILEQKAYGMVNAAEQIILAL